MMHNLISGVIEALWIGFIIKRIIENDNSLFCAFIGYKKRLTLFKGMFYGLNFLKLELAVKCLIFYKLHMTISQPVLR